MVALRDEYLRQDVCQMGVEARQGLALARCLADTNTPPKKQ